VFSVSSKALKLRIQEQALKLLACMRAFKSTVYMIVIGFIYQVSWDHVVLLSPVQFCFHLFAIIFIARVFNLGLAILVQIDRSSRPIPPDGSHWH